GMENIKIPSPSAILDPPPAMPSRSPPSPAKKTAGQPATNPTTNKPKQSKSRNGCTTCKTKRLKCDESKPTCLQCKKRNVQCGGYKKDFKWRPFEETNIGSKATTKTKKEDSVSTTMTQSTLARQSPLRYDESQSIQGSPPKPVGIPPRNSNDSPAKQKDLASSWGELLGHPNMDCFDDQNTTSSLTHFSPPDQSPWLSDLLPAASDLDMNSEEPPFEISLQHSPRNSDGFSFSALLEEDNEDVEEMVQQTNPGVKPWILQFSGKNTSSPKGSKNATASIYREPSFDVASPEMLIVRYDRFTCGILSVKDGMNENPWRTLIWPLAKDSPALYHAIFALTAFHSSKESPELRVHGVDHMRKSITFMVQDIQNMKTDAALATSLALAFADTWDQHTQTCIQHLRGAKALVSQVLRFGIQNGMQGADLERVRFLYNTWLYMDVIARLTSREECSDQEMDFSISHLSNDSVHEIDPLMGCAATLFPLINRVTLLIQQVRKSESNSLSLVSQAIELKGLLEQWEPPRWFEPPEDPTSEVQHSIQIAYAYRWATLLYLHQAVPEMPSEPTSVLAKRVLILLATVPPSSRTTIIQMFPLLAAGCEAEQEDRTWVLERWTSIQSRLMLGAIDRCIDVVQEVWSRQDKDKAEKARRQSRGTGRSGPYFAMEGPGKNRLSHGGGPEVRSSAVSPLENIEFDKTIRGRLHWISVMEEWGWEGKQF
ncbi:hypothetical protein ASPWEDRAFT_105483, partial [Aspergillus wentii DTO 134E9]